MDNRIPSNVSNPKTIRRYERYWKKRDEMELVAKEYGFTVIKTFHDSWSIKHDEGQSVYGCDSPDEALYLIHKTVLRPGITKDQIFRELAIVKNKVNEQ